MKYDIRDMRPLGDISSLRELKEARRELELQAWYAEKRLSEGADDVFSMEGLLSMIAPPGSAADRIAGGIGTGIAAMRGIGGAFGMWRDRRRSRSNCGCGC